MFINAYLGKNRRRGSRTAVIHTYLVRNEVPFPRVGLKSTTVMFTAARLYSCTTTVSSISCLISLPYITHIQFLYYLYPYLHRVKQYIVNFIVFYELQRIIRFCVVANVQSNYICYYP